MNQFEQKPVNVVNNLTSDSTTDALSAAQGKALNSNKAQFVEIVDSSVSDPVQAIKNKISSIPTNKTLLINITTKSLSYAVFGFVSPASGYSTFVIQGYDSGNATYIHHLIQNQGNWTDFDIGILNSNMVNKGNITVLTGTTGNTVGTGTEITMPSGYTASNTVVIGMQYDDSGTWRVFGVLNAIYPCIISTTILANNKINIIPRDNAGLNRNVKVTVFRYTT